jgi:hypothetical protein
VRAVRRAALFDQLAEAATAHKAFEERTTIGKTALAP